MPANTNTPTHLPALGVQFPIVGIGASAGGLEAIEEFLQNVPEMSGMAFVIVQHLEPKSESMMPDLLGRCTPMKVFQIKDRQKIEPNCVYIIPPNKDLTIAKGFLYLHEIAEKHGLRLTIDSFFYSLADDQKERSIGVILSGMGSDGMLGAEAIREKAGVVFVQEPTDAKFDAMPLSVINGGLADVVEIVKELPLKIKEYLTYTPYINKPRINENVKIKSGLEKIVVLIRQQTGHDFSQYKESSLYRRIERRMGVLQLSGIAQYVDFAHTNPQEVELLFREMLIGVTSFFRDTELWERLRTDVLPQLLVERHESEVLRAWVAACSTGEEAFSLAILFTEFVESLHLPMIPKNMTLQIFATDLDTSAIEKARKGVFSGSIANDISEERLGRYFTRLEGGGYQIVKSIRDMVIFAPQNVIMDPPFTKLHLLMCRNLLIYLTSELQHKLLPLFHFALKENGFLVLGTAETTGSVSALFAPLDEKMRIYQRLQPLIQKEPIFFPTIFKTSHPSTTAKPVMKTIDNVKVFTDNLILEKYAPAAVLTGQSGDILYISGRTGKYLEPPAGKINWNIFAMAREGLGHELMSAFRKAQAEQKTQILRGIVLGTNTGKQTLDVVIQPIVAPDTLYGSVLVVFIDVPTALEPATKSTTSKRGKVSNVVSLENRTVEELEKELDRFREEMRTSQEELRTMNEELQSANEELQSTNEELQSTNEELMTSKEEMQSMNEELQTVNSELQVKVDELSHTSNDIKNLLDSTEIATLFLDSEMLIRRFNNRISKMTKLILSDVGRSITDIASELLYPELVDDAHEVLQTLVSIEKQLPLSNNQWFSVRILPYRTLKNVIDGVVIIFTDITVSKTLEAELRATEARLRALLEERPTLDSESGKVVDINT